MSIPFRSHVLTHETTHRTPCSLALKVHRDALLAMRSFWETLMHNQVPFRTLARCIKNMDVTIRTADRVYK
jgi:hypothetical protein